MASIRVCRWIPFPATTTVAYALLSAECRANFGNVLGLYHDRPYASSRPAWYRKVDAQHDVGLEHVKVHTIKSAWMLEKLSRELIAPSVRASIVTCVL